MEKLKLSSEHVNYLILRYLQENRFPHSAYTFANECGSSRDAFQPGEVPPGALIHLLQKGLQFIEMEANVSKNGEGTETYTMIDSKDLITKDINQLRKDIQAKKEGNITLPLEDMVVGNVPDDVEMTDSKEVEEITEDKVMILKGHTDEVFLCSWSPTEDLLASGSGDSSARVWSFGENVGSIVLSHYGEGSEESSGKSKDVTSIDWSPDGTQLATGSYDGLARIWSKTGQLITTFRKHQGPILSLKWNSKGNALLSGSADQTAFVWDAKTGEARQSFEYHRAAVLDVDWKDNKTFASCSTDHTIYVCRLGEEEPIKAFNGHGNEVNAIKWDPTGRLLASCSDDTTARIWSLGHDEPLIILEGHTKEIYTVKWGPTENVSSSVLASASFDATIKLWDLETGKYKHDMARHVNPVYTIAFNPDGRLLASGSFDKKVLVWSVSDGQLVKSFDAKDGIFEVCWNRDGNYLAACSRNKLVSVLDMRS